LEGGRPEGVGLTRGDELCPTQFNLAIRLHRAFPGQAFVIRNFGDAGETAGEFLSRGRVEIIREALPHLDVVFLRYGIADRKREGIPKTVENVTRLCRRLKEVFPSVAIIIETDMWVDYPKHYLWDRNPHLAPLYDRLRHMATSEGYALVDIFANVEAETRQGNWDLRIRAVPVEGMRGIQDDSFDDLFGDDPAFFTNVHPNARCLGLIAEWEVAKLKELFGDKLPVTKCVT
jgi:acyl-CoA thioesterase-1